MELSQLINKQKYRAADIAVIMVALIVMFNIYKFQNKNVQSLKGKIEEEKKKIEVLDNINKSERVISAYKNLINKKDISLAINTISDIARDAKVSIVIIKPMSTENQAVYIKYPFNLVFNAADYHAVGKFINRIEAHQDIYFVDKISMKPKSPGKDSPKDHSITVDLTISTILFKE